MLGTDAYSRELVLAMPVSFSVLPAVGNDTWGAVSQIDGNVFSELGKRPQNVGPSTFSHHLCHHLYIRLWL
jgi:hypothetical protein